MKDIILSEYHATTQEIKLISARKSIKNSKNNKWKKEKRSANSKVYSGSIQPGLRSLSR